MALLVVAVNALISSYVSRRFQRAILGFEPEEIGRLYVELDVTYEHGERGYSEYRQPRRSSFNQQECLRYSFY